MVAVLFTAGDHVPNTPLLDMVAKFNAVPLHMGGMVSNEGVRIGFTTTVRVVCVAHTPEAGVNVYVVVAALLIAGDQVPLMLLVEMEGNVKFTPAHTGAIGLKEVVTVGMTVTLLVADSAHCPSSGVNV